MQKTLIQKFFPKSQPEGDGAEVIRILPSRELKSLSPLLMLDLFCIKLPAGFPDHPHRGFETVTYVLEGNVLHEDFGGNSGKIGPGDVQWMTAGKGIVHAEMPDSWDHQTRGFQIWINLPKDKKMVPPAYQEFKAEDITSCLPEDGVKIIVIAGIYEKTISSIIPVSDSFFYDVHLAPGKSASINIYSGWQGLVYLYSENQGKLSVGDSSLKTGQAGNFISSGDPLILRNDGQNEIRFVVAGGKPLEDEVVQHGPFVMSTDEEIYQTFEDYQMAKNGFERRKGWRSKIAKLNQSF